MGRQAPTSGPPDLSLLKYMPKIYFNYINTASLNLYTFPSGQMKIEGGGGGRYLKIERRDGRHLGEVFERRAKFQHRRKQVENVEEWVFRDSGGRVKGGWNLILKNIRLGCIYLLSAMKRECECFRNWK